MSKFTLVVVVVVRFAVAASVAVGEDRVIRIDFGLNTQQTTTTGWNNFTGDAGATPTATLNLVDSGGTATGITLVPTWSAMNFDVGVAGTAANYDGPYPIIPIGSDPPFFPSALRDSVYVRDGESLTLSLSNLPIDSSYEFLFYGAADNTGDYSLFTVTGSNSGQDHITPLVNNSTEVADNIRFIRPDAMRKIVILFEGRRPNGAPQLPNVNDDGLGRLNYLSIAQYTLPPGDYSGEKVVNAEDYAVWRATFASNTNVAADGNLNGIVDAADYVVWRKAMSTAGGATASSSADSLAVPEPHAALLLAAMIFSVCGLRVRDRGRSRG